MTRITPVKEHELRELEAAANADKHAMIAPTYVVRKEGEIIGYIGVVPSILVWLHTEKAKVRDATLVMDFFESIITSNGAPIIGVPCKDESPMFPFMEKVGYVPVSKTTFFLKNLNKD